MASSARRGRWLYRDGLVAASLLCSGAWATADSPRQIVNTPTDRALLHGVERHTFGSGYTNFRRHPGAPHLYPYIYRVYPFSRDDAGLDVRAVKPAGRLIVTAQPDNATVFVDGHPLVRGGDSTFQIGLLVGPHHLEVQAPGYSSHRQEVDIRTNHQHRMEIILEPQ